MGRGGAPIRPPPSWRRRWRRRAGPQGPPLTAQVQGPAGRCRRIRNRAQTGQALGDFGYADGNRDQMAPEGVVCDDSEVRLPLGGLSLGVKCTAHLHPASWAGKKVESGVLFASLAAIVGHAAGDEQGWSGPYQREIRQSLACRDPLGDFGGEMLQPADKAIRRALANARGTSQRVRLAGESGSAQETIRTPTTATAGPEEGPHQGQAGRRNAGARRNGACPASPPERRISARCARQKSPSAAESASTCPRH